MKYRFSLLLVVLFIGASGIAQPWMKQSFKTEGPVNFYDLKNAYDAWFSTHPKVKGSGSKQFERYAWFMEPRVYPSGYLPEKALWQAWEEKQRESRLKTDSYTANWTPMGPFDTPRYSDGSAGGSGRINCIAFHPTDPDIIYVGAPSGGVWMTTDGGENWKTTTDFLPALGVSDLAIHPDNPDIIYMVTGDKDGGNTSPTYSYGILKSTDAGNTWEATGLVHETSQTIRMRRLVILAGEEEVLLTGGSDGLYRSTDGGTSWDKIGSGNYFDLEMKPGDPSIVYACTNSAIFKSTDTGLNFERLENGLPATGLGRIEMAVTKANPEVLYAVGTNSKNGFKALYKSADSGESFTTQSTEDDINIFSYAVDGSGDGSGIGWYAIALAVDQEDENMVYSGSVNLWSSADGGQNWTISAHWYGAQGLPYVHADEHILAVNPLTNECYSGNDGGFYRTSDKGASWTEFSDGLSILQIYRIGASASNPQKVIEGSQDNGTFRYRSGQWTKIMGGDGMECAIDPQNEFIMYATTQNGGLNRSVNNQGFNSIRPSGSGAWITPFQISQLSPNILVAGYEAVYLTANRGDSWEKISGELAGGSSMNELAIAPSDDRYIYVSQQANLWMTDDRGGSWTNISNGLPDLTIEYIAVAQSEPLKVWVTFSGYEEGKKVYFSEDGGNSWINYSEGLPNIPVNCITYKNNSSYSLYCGTDLGVYYRTQGLEEWVPFDDQLPNVIVNELEINYRVNKIRAGTFGRGLWESDLVEDGNFPPALQLTANEGHGTISLDWFAATDRSPDHYLIMRDGEEYTTSVSNTFVDKVANWIIHEYAVIAVYPDGVSTPTNAVISRGVEEIELPYSQNFESEAYGWLISNQVTGWQWGTGAELGLNLLGDSKMVATNSAEASKEDKNASGYAILPKMHLAGQENLILRFDYAMRRWQELDHLYLRYKIADETEWTTLVELDPSGRMWRWTEFSMEVPAEILADDLELAFYYTDSKDIGYGAAIDNFYLGPETSSSEELVLEKQVKVFPNPADSDLNINLSGFTNETVQLRLFDINGRNLYKQKIEVNSANFTEVINLTQWSSGVYTLELRSGTKSYTEQVHIK